MADIVRVLGHGAGGLAHDEIAPEIARLNTALADEQIGNDDLRESLRMANIELARLRASTVSEIARLLEPGDAYGEDDGDVHAVVMRKDDFDKLTALVAVGREMAHAKHVVDLCKAMDKWRSLEGKR